MSQFQECIILLQRPRWAFSPSITILNLSRWYLLNKLAQWATNLLLYHQQCHLAPQQPHTCLSSTQLEQMIQILMSRLKFNREWAYPTTCYRELINSSNSPGVSFLHDMLMCNLRICGIIMGQREVDWESVNPKWTIFENNLNGDREDLWRTAGRARAQDQRRRRQLWRDLGARCHARQGWALLWPWQTRLSHWNFQCCSQKDYRNRQENGYCV